MAIAVSAAATSLHGRLSDTHARKSCRSAHSIPSGQAAFHNGKEQHIACPSALIWGGSWVQQVVGIDSRGCTPVKAEWVSTWDDRPTPGPYSFTVSWSMSDSTPGSSRCARCALRALRPAGRALPACPSSHCAAAHAAVQHKPMVMQRAWKNSCRHRWLNRSQAM